jgi:hypothetical protein
VNALPLLARPPRAVVFNDGGRAKDDSGVEALAVLERRRVAAATVDARSAAIGDPVSTYEDGVVSAVNAIARRAGVRVGQPARAAARRLLGL